jgi:hypothetical protein
MISCDFNSLKREREKKKDRSLGWWNGSRSRTPA